MLGATAHLLVEDEITLIDAGHRGSGSRVRRYLEGLGRSVREITRILVTHSHPDHIGGVAEIAAASGASVHLHPADSTRLRIGLREALSRPTPGPLLALITRPVTNPRPLADGDILPALGGLRVVHTPGHTPGSVCFYAPSARVLFSGDVLQVSHGRLARPNSLFSDDLGEARRSLARLVELNIDTICFAHYPPLRSGGTAELRTLLAGWA